MTCFLILPQVIWREKSRHRNLHTRYFSRQINQHPPKISYFDSGPRTNIHKPGDIQTYYQFDSTFECPLYTLHNCSTPSPMPQKRPITYLLYIEPEQHINRNEQLSLIYIKQTALLLVQKSNMFSIKPQALFFFYTT